MIRLNWDLASVASKISIIILIIIIIRLNNDTELLQHYFNKLSVLYIDEQLWFFPNLIEVINSYIVTSNILFESFIIHNNLLITDVFRVKIFYFIETLSLLILNYFQVPLIIIYAQYYFRYTKFWIQFPFKFKILIFRKLFTIL